MASRSAGTDSWASRTSTNIPGGFPFSPAGPDRARIASSRNGYLLGVCPPFANSPECPSRTAQGKSLKSVLTGKARKVREVTYGAYCGGQAGHAFGPQGYWKLIKYGVLEAKSQTQLFNLKDNPEEILIEHHAPEVVAKTGYQPNEKQVNLADDPKFAHSARRWTLLLSEMRRLGLPFGTSPQD